jgi:hypothetical protein
MMVDEYVVRFGEEKDINTIQGLIVFYFIPKLDMLRMITNKRLVVCELENKVIGVFIISAKRNRVLDFVVDKKQRLNGVGRIMFSKGCGLMETDKSLLTLQATFADDSHPGQNSVPFWKKIGFVEDGPVIVTKKNHLLQSMRWKNE